ncbi:MAG: hypothetical protein CMK07_03750 [Ponticaulis sp.]|nr:hypothetical protein [Ponticaulis sp.]
MNIARVSKLLGLTNWQEEEATVEVSTAALKRLISRAYPAQMEFDEDWYRETYPDVDQSITDGTIKSAQEHFIHNGFYENRLPSSKLFDSKYYYQANEDIQTAFRSNDKNKLFDHYIKAGITEGRAPNKDSENI